MSSSDGKHGYENPAMESTDMENEAIEMENNVAGLSSQPETTAISINQTEQKVNGQTHAIAIDEGEDGLHSPFGCIGTYLKVFFEKLLSILQRPRVKKRLKIAAITVAVVIYCVYFIAVILTPTKRENDNYWCDSDGLLIILNSIVAIFLFYFKVFKVHILKSISSTLLPSWKKIRQLLDKRYVKPALYGIFIMAFIIGLFFDSVEDRSRLVSAFGVFVLIGLGTLFSAFPTQIDYRQVIWGIIIQIFFGLLILRWPIGKDVFQCTGDKVSVFLNFTYVGSTFAFGNIVTDMNSYVFSFLTMILFFGMFVSVLYYNGILQWIILKLGWLLEITMGTTPCESMSAAANIFLGQSEAPLVIKPYLPYLTKSELHAVLTGGYATIAGTILAAYISFGIAPAHLISASVMSAPAALAMSKLFYPETEKSQTKSSNIKVMKSEETNVLHAIMNGLWSAVPLITIITVAMIAFMALIAFANAVLDWGCQLLSYEPGTCEFQGGLGYILAPIAWIMGVPIEDCYKVGYLLATKLFLTEFIAYRDLMVMFEKGLISARSVVICTYAFCGFSSIASLGSFGGALGSLAPTRAKDISDLLFRALIAGNFASYLTACVAGTLIQDSSSPVLPFHSNGTM